MPRRSLHPATRATRGALLAVALAIALPGVLAACSSDGGAAAETTAPASVATTAATTTTLPPTTTTLVSSLAVPVPAVTEGVWVRADQPGATALDPTFEAALLAFVQTYVDAATAKPAAGQPSAVDPLLSEAALARLDANGRAVLADDGLPQLASAVLAPPQVSITALTGLDGTTVSAVTLQVNLTGTTAAGAPVSVARSGELSVVFDGTRFAIDGFRLDVQKDIP